MTGNYGESVRSPNIGGCDDLGTKFHMSTLPNLGICNARAEDLAEYASNMQLSITNASNLLFNIAVRFWKLVFNG
jgi:hypothetical protein